MSDQPKRWLPSPEVGPLPPGSVEAATPDGAVEEGATCASRPGEGTTGDPGPGEGVTGDPGPGEGVTGDPGPGEGTSGDPGPGEGVTSDPGPGEDTTGDPGPGEGVTSDPGPGEGTTGDPGPGEGVTSDPGPGEGTTGDPGPGEGTTGDPGPGEGTTGDPGPGEGTTGDPGPGGGTTGDPGPGEGMTGDPEPGEGTTGAPRAGEGATGDPGPGEGTTNAPGLGDGTPVYPADLSRLYPPLPRGEFSPIVPPSLTHGHRDEFFALRPGTLQAAISETEAKLLEEDGRVEGAWLLTEVDHWNRETERLVLLTPRVLLVCHYDFVGLYCHLMLRIPLHYIDNITVGHFQFPATSLSRRCGLGLRVQWDKLREPSFRSWWNPWSRDLPFIILTEHPGAEREHQLSSVCKLHRFRAELTRLVQVAHREQPLPGRANGPLLLEKPLQMETTLGLVSALSNWSQLGYAKPRGLFSF